MDDSTRRVLDLIYDLQFTGRTPTDPFLISIRHMFYFDPVPMMAIRAELAGSGIDADRECRLLVAMDAIVRSLHAVATHTEYRRPDGRIVKIDLVADKRDYSHLPPDATRPEFLTAYLDGEFLCDHNARLGPCLTERPWPGKEWRYQIESFAMKSAGMQLFSDERGDGTRQSTPDFSHSDCFRSIQWNGREFSFTPAQAQVIERLYGNWKKGTPDVAIAYLVEKGRLPDLFKTKDGKHPAWDTLLINGKTKGTKRLNLPKTI